MTDAQNEPADLSAVPLFPLPNVVLFPRAVLPLHIFEPRYRAMTADVLRGDRQIAMALLKPGWEKNYYSRPDIEPIVCVGRILTHEALPDGCYNFLLQGQARARILSERPGGAYRVARLQPLAEDYPTEDRLLPHRRRLADLIDAGSLLATTIGRQFRQLLNSALPTADVADLIAFNFFDDVNLKQMLLGEPDVLKRVTLIVQGFEMLSPTLERRATARTNPSLN